jgi:predicted RecB family nuclease
MQRLGDQLLCSPSDLANFVACEHLTQLDLGIALESGRRPTVENAYPDLIKRKGEEHEAGFLEALESAGRRVARVGLREPPDFDAAARATVEAMRAGAEYVYQAVFLLNGWRGIADLLERVERPSSLGSWSYEVLDTKLARHPRPEHALQLCFYAQGVARIQGVESEVAYVVLGTRERIAIRLANVSAYYFCVPESALIIGRLLGEGLTGERSRECSSVSSNSTESVPALQLGSFGIAICFPVRAFATI